MKPKVGWPVVQLTYTRGSDLLTTIHGASCLLVHSSFQVIYLIRAYPATSFRVRECPSWNLDVCYL
ncbi:hypothetical protein BS17DRAFT_774531 [Gyrodon lividus]|nr:hypothetical protein BS17DRAFT_774531 [Gyrodon lividus]